MVKLLKREISISLLSAIISLYTLIAYHYPLFKLVTESVEGGINSVIITGGLAILMLATNFMIGYIFLYLFRGVGRWIIAISLIADAVSLYFINTYDVLITASMMGNVFNTRYSEASQRYCIHYFWVFFPLSMSSRAKSITAAQSSSSNV